MNTRNPEASPIMLVCLAVILFSAAMLVLAGCVTPYSKYRVAGLRWIVADPASVDQHCRDKAKRADDGHLLGPQDHVRCCYIASKQTIVMGRGEEDCALHELAHATGMPQADVDTYIHLDRDGMPRQPLTQQQYKTLCRPTTPLVIPARPH